jgi:GT2 family glycosyltransferase
MTGSVPKPSRAPSVLVVLVVQEAAPWLRDCLSSLAAQTYPRLGVVAIDDASRDGSREILTKALGEGRVLTLPEPVGTARAVATALGMPAAASADFVCFLHDDVELDPEAIAQMVEAATAIPDVGVVGPKVVDHDNPRLLRDVGRSADRFGHGYTPLQPGEIDQGQFDRVIEVLAVSSSAMLISRSAWQHAGSFDERLHSDYAGLDLCWRVRLTGAKVLMTPLATVRHRSSSFEEKKDLRHHHSRRYEEDRSALASMLRNYSLLSLLWLLPLSVVLSAVRIVYLTLSRRFDEAYDVLAAIGWNISHLWETFSRRRLTQRSRRVKDRDLHTFMESAGLRLPRWFMTAEKILEEQREIGSEEADEAATKRLRDRTASLAAAHPVVVAGFLGACVGAFALRGFFSGVPLVGAALPAFPAASSGFFAELVSGYRTTGLGGTLAASPALGAMGGLSTLLLGSTALAQKVMLAGGVGLAAVLMYRACVRITHHPAASVVAAVAYSLSAVVLWAFSQGRIDLLITLAVLPPLVERSEVAFGPDPPPDGRFRFCAGLAVTLAVAIAFLPGSGLAVVVLVAVGLIGGRSRLRGLAMFLISTAGAAVLLFTFVPSLYSGAGAAFGSTIGTTDLRSLSRLALGDAPGSWAIAWFLPVAATLCFALSGERFRGPARRAMLVVLLGLPLAWLSAANYMPAQLSNAPVFVALVATAGSMLIAFGLASVLSGLGKESFGLRQIASILMWVVLGVGIFLQGAAAMVGGWGIGGADKIAAAWQVASSSQQGDYRVLWVGSPDGQPFPAPGGDPIRVAPAGDASVAYALTDQGGITALDTGRTLTGPGADALAEAMNEIVSGTTVHGGALLAPFGALFVIADPDHMSSGALSKLQAQVDLTREPQSGLIIFRNTDALPPSSVLATDTTAISQMLSGDPASTSMFISPYATPLAEVEGGWSGVAPTGTAYISTQWNGSWKLNGGAEAPRKAFGWATAFPAAAAVGAGQSTASDHVVDIRYGSQLLRTLESWLLVVLWAAALWVTRKPVAR